MKNTNINNREIKPCSYCGDRGWYSEVKRNYDYFNSEVRPTSEVPEYTKKSILCMKCNSRLKRKPYFIKEEMEQNNESLQKTKL